MSEDFEIVLSAFLSSRPRKRGNYSTNGQTLLYFASPILIRDPSGLITMSFCGRPSVTAKKCLNHFLSTIGRVERFHTVKGQLLLGDTPVSSTDRLPLPLA
jgi:hypothetical protein